MDMSVGMGNTSDTSEKVSNNTNNTGVGQLSKVGRINKDRLGKINKGRVVKDWYQSKGWVG